MSQQFGPSYLELPPREIFIVSTRGKSGEDDTPSHANLGSKSCEKVFCEPEAPRYSRNGVSKPVYFTFEGLTPDSTMDDDRDEQENVQMLMENDPVKVIRSDIETHDREMETFSCINSGSSGADNPAKENLWQAERVNTSSPPSSMEPDCIRNLSKPMSYYYTEYESLEEEVPFDEDPICHKFSQNNMSLNAPTLHHPPKCLPDRIAPILTPIIEVNSPICSPYEDVKEKEKIKMVQSLSPAALDVDEDNDNEQVDYVPTLEDTHVSSREEGFPSKIRGPIDTSQSLLDQEVVGVPSDEIHGPRRSESSEGSSTCNYASNEFCRHLEFFQFLESLENDIYDN